jgi:hypothetical protein
MIEPSNFDTSGETGRYLERVKIKGMANVALDIAERLYLRHRLGGKEYIITAEPHELLSLVQKRWAKLTRQSLKQRESATDTEAIIELSRQITYMQNLRFTKQPFDEPEARVVATTFESAIIFPPVCGTMYVSTLIQPAQLAALTGQMPTPRVVVVYQQPD